MFKLYSHLAIKNIKNDLKRFAPFYIVMTLLCVMVYNFISMLMNPYLAANYGARSINVVLQMGLIVISLATIIIGFYAYSFVLKGRQEEFSLLNTLGLEKKHIHSMILVELSLLFIATILMGIFLGVVVDKIILAAISFYLDGKAKIGFFISNRAILLTVLAFFILYLGFYIRTGFQISMNSITDLKQLSSQGEKEPKARIWLAILGILFLGIGYYLALTIKNPLKAFMMFGFAVLSVIIGTYLLITAGSISYLKLRKKNKKDYYKTENFVNISNLIYRMKANAAGLGNIAILSTMVIIMVSMSINIIGGIKATVDSSYSRDYELFLSITNKEAKNSVDHYVYIDAKEADIYRKKIEDVTRKYQSEIKDLVSYQVQEVSAHSKGGQFSFSGVAKIDTADDFVVVPVYFLLQEDTNAKFQTNLNLKKGEIAIYDPDQIIKGEKLDYFGIPKSFQKIENLDIRLIKGREMEMFKPIYIVLDSLESLKEVNVLQEKFNGAINNPRMTFKFNGPKSQIESYIADVNKAISEEVEVIHPNGWTAPNLNSKELNYKDMLNIYIGIIYVLLMLSVLFTVTSVLVIYYKQVSEGHKDRENYQIMKKVGMDEEMIQQTIRKQVKTVFFLPPMIALCHVMGAMHFMALVMKVIVHTEVAKFMWITVGTLVVYLLFFYVVYKITAKTYYQIVNQSGA